MEVIRVTSYNTENDDVLGHKQFQHNIVLGAKYVLWAVCVLILPIYDMVEDNGFFRYF